MVASMDGESKLLLNVGLYKKGIQERFVMEGTAVSNAIISFYRIDDTLITCEKGDPYEDFDDSSEYECSTEIYSSDEQYAMLKFVGNKFIEWFQDYDDYTVEYIGEKTIIGRNCYQFEISLDNFVEFFIAGYSTDERIDSGDISPIMPFPKQSKLKVCLDQKTGHELYSGLLSFSQSELVENSYTEYSAVIAILFESGLDDSEFTIPIKFAIDREGNDADELLVLINPFMDYSGTAELKIYDSSRYSSELSDVDLLDTIDLGTVDLKAMKLHKINVKHGISFDLNASGYAYSDSKTYEICLGDDCQRGPIIHSDFDDSYNSMNMKCLNRSLDKDSCTEDSDCAYAEPYCLSTTSYNYY